MWRCMTAEYGGLDCVRACARVCVFVCVCVCRDQSSRCIGRQPFSLVMWRQA